MAAFKRALHLAPKENIENLIGLGVSCSLARPEGEREGREHKAYITIQTEMATASYMFHLQKVMDQLSHNTREEEETFVSDRILEILAETMGLGSSDYVNKGWTDTSPSKPGYLEILTGQRKFLAFPKPLLFGHNDVVAIEGDIIPNGRVIFSGSFNPVHDGHMQMAAKAAELTQKQVDFEVCVHNVDKPSLNFKSLQARADGMFGSLRGKSYTGLTLFTSTPTFVQKAETFPNSQFIVGWDTFKRIGDPKYYGGEEGLIKALARLRQLNIQFLVFHRIIDGKSSIQESLASIPTELIAMSTICGEDVLPPTGYSSSEIRKSK
jgi:hypothetical protein